MSALDAALARVRAQPFANLLLVLTAVAAAFLLLRRAFFGLDVQWDTLTYHLPFAARLAGLCDQDCYRLVWWQEARFEGFPMLATWLQSLVWRVAGKPDWNDLVNIAGLAVLVTSARVCLRAPVALTLTALLAVPLIQIHTGSTYIDLFTNAMMATAVVLLASAFLEAQASPWRGLLPLLPVAAATNSKFQMLPIGALVALGVTLLLVHRLRGRALREVMGPIVGTDRARELHRKRCRPW
jgi:hypothetical protein